MRVTYYLHKGGVCVGNDLPTLPRAREITTGQEIHKSIQYGQNILEGIPWLGAQQGVEN